MNTRKKLAFPLLLNLHIEIYEERKAHSSWGLFKFIFIIHNLQNSFICSGALAAASNDVRKIASSQSSSSLSFSADARKGGGPFPAYRPPPTANPTISFASVPRQRWVLNCGKQTAAPLSSKRGTGESWASSQRAAHNARKPPPQGHRVRAPCPNKRRNSRVCHRVSNNEDTDPHTS